MGGMRSQADWKPRRIAHADGGESTFENLRLRCRAHNLHAAEERFGAGTSGRESARAQDRKGQDRTGQGATSA